MWERAIARTGNERKVGAGVVGSGGELAGDKIKGRLRRPRDPSCDPRQWAAQAPHPRVHILPRPYGHRLSLILAAALSERIEDIAY